MTRPVDYLRSRSLPLLALVEAARIVFGTADKRLGKRRQVPMEPSGNPGQFEPFGNAEQLRLEGMK